MIIILIEAALLWDVIMCSLVCRCKHVQGIHWKWKQYISLKCCCVSTKLLRLTSQKTVVFIATAMRPSNLIWCCMYSSWIQVGNAFCAVVSVREGVTFFISFAPYNYHCWKATELLFNLGLCSSAMWCLIAERLVPDVLRQHSGLIIRGWSVQEDWSLNNHPDGAEPHPRRTETSTTLLRKPENLLIFTGKRWQKWLCHVLYHISNNTGTVSKHSLYIALQEVS